MCTAPLTRARRELRHPIGRWFGATRRSMPSRRKGSREQGRRRAGRRRRTHHLPSAVNCQETLPCGMGRRGTGLALLVAAVVAAVIVPAVGGHRVVGTAERPRPGDPPRAADCLHAVPMVPSPLNLRLPVYADGTGECGDQNFGEVVTVISKVYFSPPTLDNGQTVAEPVD